MPETETNGSEVAGPLVHVIHVDESTTDTTRTLLALAAKDDLNFATEEESEDINLGAERSLRRYRTTNAPILEVSSVMAVDMSAMELIGLSDSDGKLTFDTDSRRLRPGDDEYIEVAYQAAEDNAYADAQLVHRFEDIEAMSPEIDMSATPPLVSWTWMVHGDTWLSYSEA